MATVNRAQPTQTTQRQHVLGRLVYSHSRQARLLRWVAVAVGMTLGLVSFRICVASLLPQYGFAFRKDFLQEYTLARAVADGIDPYLPTQVLAERYLGALPGPVFPHPTPHPPTVGLLLLPLSLFDYLTAQAVWFALELLCLVAAVYLLGRALDMRVSVFLTLVVVTGLIGWHILFEELILGQMAVPVLTLLAGAWVALRSGRPGLGGALLGLAILMKPVPLPILLLLALRKDWRALLGATGVILSGYLASAGVMGLDSLQTYFTEVLPSAARSYRAHEWNISLSSVGWRVFDGTGSDVVAGMRAPPLVTSAPAAALFSLALPALLLVVAFLFLRKQRCLDVSFAVMVSVSILTFPISWGHNLVLALIPAAQLIRWLRCRRLPSKETNLALIAAMLLIVDWGRLAHFLAGLGPIPDGAILLRFALAQLPLMTAGSVGALAWLVASLGPAEGGVLATVEE